jgi:cardiolipin synthase A/B
MRSVLPALDYLDDLISEIDKAKKSVLLQTMMFEEGVLINRLEKHLIKAAHRGVDVRVNYDWVAEKYVHGNLPLVPVIDAKKRRYIDRIQEKNRQMYKRLEENGVILSITNDVSFPISTMPYLGRSHIKLAAVDQEIGWVGGVNLYDGAFGHIDFMVKSRKKTLVDALYKEFSQINDNKSPNDYKVKIDELENLYVDVGGKGKSIIYDTAKKRIRNAKSSIIFMSQFVPDTRLLKEVSKAQERGVRINILTSSLDDPAFNKYPEKLSYLVLKNSIDGKEFIKIYHLNRKVHAKLIIVDGEVALYGSHNYTYTGVLFGTAEMMMETREKEIIKQLLDFIKENSKELDLQLT